MTRIDLTHRRAMIGPPEDIAVVGPRGSGKTTIALLLARHLTETGKSVRVISTQNWSQEVGRKYDVHIYDGFMPERPCRVISMSEIW